MGIGDFAVGTLWLGVTIAPLAVGACTLRTRVLPAWPWWRARVLEFVLVLAALTVIAEVLGVVGLLSRGYIIVTSALVGTAGFLAARRIAVEASEESEQPVTFWPADPVSRVLILISGLVVAVVSLQWLAASVAGLRGTLLSVDTLWYHGPAAARFVQGRSITGIQYFDDNAHTAFFPGGSALPHAVGIALFGNDVLSPLVNMAFFVVACLASYSIGARYRAGPIALLAVVVVLGTPTMIQTQPGAQYNDVMGLALVLASAALLIASDGRGWGLVAAGLAAGLAIGTKYTMLVSIGGLTLALLYLFRRDRWRRLLVWSAAVAATGGVWYLRNIVTAGSPVPGLQASIGPLSFPRLPSTLPLERVAKYVANPSVVRHVYVPGLNTAFGAGWWILLLGGVVGPAIILVAPRSGPTARALAGVAVLGFIGFLLTPQYLGLPGAPIFFSVNLRYVVTPLALGLLLVPCLPGMQSTAARSIGVGSLIVAFALAQPRAFAVWPAQARDILIASTALVAGGAIVLAAKVLSWGEQRAAIAVLTAAGLAGALVASWVVQRNYIANRLQDNSVARLSVVAAISHDRHQRIATEGFFLQYALYGPDLSNHVQYLGQVGSNGAFTPFHSCTRWAQAINAGHYDFLVVAPSSYPASRTTPSPWVGWAARQTVALRPVAHDGSTAATYKLVGQLDPSSCPAATATSTGGHAPPSQ